MNCLPFFGDFTFGILTGSEGELEMEIRVVPFTAGSIHNPRVQITEDTEERIKKNDPPIICWGIYLNNKQVKLWIEVWLKDRP
jgi:hypothetical protein